MIIASLDTFLALFSRNPSNYWTYCKRNDCFSKCLCLAPNPAGQSVNYSHCFVLDHQVFLFPCTSSFISRQNNIVLFLHVVSGYWNMILTRCWYHFPSRLQSCLGSMLSSSPAAASPLLGPSTSRIPDGPPTRLTRVRTAGSPFSSTEISSHQQALHVRPRLFSWVTELSPLLPFLWKRSCLVTERHEEHSALSLSSVQTPPSAPILVVLAPAACLMQTPKRSDFSFFALSDFKSDLICVQMPWKIRLRIRYNKRFLRLNINCGPRTESWVLGNWWWEMRSIFFLSLYICGRFSAEHAFLHIHTLYYLHSYAPCSAVVICCLSQKKRSTNWNPLSSRERPQQPFR